eukprot:250316-Rhodomonas_salina.3
MALLSTPLYCPAPAPWFPYPSRAARVDAALQRHYDALVKRHTDTEISLTETEELLDAALTELTAAEANVNWLQESIALKNKVVCAAAQTAKSGSLAAAAVQEKYLDECRRRLQKAKKHMIPAQQKLKAASVAAKQAEACVAMWEHKLDIHRVRMEEGLAFIVYLGQM